MMPQKVSYLKRTFYDQGQSFLYIGTINANQVKVCDSTVHQCIWNTTGNIVQYIQYSTIFKINKLFYAFKINTSLQSKGDIFGSIFLAFRNVL